MAALLVAGLPMASAAGPRTVDLELVLAVDASGSIDEAEAQLQRDGFAAAIADPQFLSAVKSGPLGRIAMIFVEWSGLKKHYVAVDWTEIASERDARRFAAAIADRSGFRGDWTSISSAIDQGIRMLDENGFEGGRRVIDISGDGFNNNGDGVEEARDRAVRAGITINGLPIVNDRAGPNGMPPAENLDLYYRDCVIGGDGAFLVAANGFSDFARAVRRKLFLEVAGWQPPPRPVRVATPGKADCLAGEKNTLRELQELNRIRKSPMAPE